MRVESAYLLACFGPTPIMCGDERARKAPQHTCAMHARTHTHTHHARTHAPHPHACSTQHAHAGPMPKRQAPTCAACAACKRVQPPGRHFPTARQGDRQTSQGMRRRCGVQAHEKACMIVQAIQKQRTMGEASEQGPRRREAQAVPHLSHPRDRGGRLALWWDIACFCRARLID